jgi:hypothetical protein
LRKIRLKVCSLPVQTDGIVQSVLFGEGTSQVDVRDRAGRIQRYCAADCLLTLGVSRLLMKESRKVK